ncbi:hypothetical protein [Pseudooceanicola algae]|uniref:Uncharacterized protein n=1 Tax=Pseudooceanicola algae TaxID=1537215 RepID=A0A418SBT6_9RHOB|nr:hypothetical protein [Pseudooceanicola algae]QPM92482.1 hypothetical protein PSAL_037460 [Pseudooceanicola algae]
MNAAIFIGESFSDIPADDLARLMSDINFALAVGARASRASPISPEFVTPLENAA